MNDLPGEEGRMQDGLESHIRLLIIDDTDAVDPLLQAAYCRPESRRVELKRYLALQPDGWFVATVDGTPAGIGGAQSYGSFAWIGLMAVAPSLQRRGIGHAILHHVLSWIDSQGCPIAMLDATPKGEPLYERHGFRDDGATIRYERVGTPSSLKLLDHVSLVRHSDLPALAAFDAPIFGANRQKVLAALLDDYPDRCFVARDAMGRMTGFLVAQPRQLGPWVSTDTDTAEALLAAALCVTYDGPPVVLTPDCNMAAHHLLAHHGFEATQALRHMYRGPAPAPQRRALIYSQTSFAIG